MSIKTVLTYSDGARGTEHRIAGAVDLARQNDAHLVVLALGFELDLPPSFDGSPPLSLPPSTAEPEAEERAQAADDMIARAGVRGEAVRVVCSMRSFAREIGDAAQFSDVVVLGRPYGEDAAETAASALEGALFDGDAPVLVFPDAVDRLEAGTVLIAWNGSRESLRAVRSAMPFLLAAQRVHIAIFGHSPSEPIPGERLATMLSSQPRRDPGPDPLRGGRGGVDQTMRAGDRGGARRHGSLRPFAVPGVRRRRRDPRLPDGVLRPRADGALTAVSTGA